MGSTPITGGTNGRILYDNSGVVGELATTGSGSVVLATSPTLVTPTLGVASATSLSLPLISGSVPSATAQLTQGGAAGWTNGSSGTQWYYTDGTNLLARFQSFSANLILTLKSGSAIGWGSGDASTTGDAYIQRAAANILAVTNAFQIGTTTAFTLATGELGLPKIAASGSAPGAAGLKLGVVCGTNAGSAKIIAYAGTSTTPATVVDNVGSGVTGC